jgi:hypothetical protein
MNSHSCIDCKLDKGEVVGRELVVASCDPERPLDLIDERLPCRQQFGLVNDNNGDGAPDSRVNTAAVINMTTNRVSCIKS